jgi:hypothetical protein
MGKNLLDDDAWRIVAARITASVFATPVAAVASNPL